MKPHLLTGAGLLALGALIPPAFAQEAEPALQDVIIVTGSRTTTATEHAVTPEAAPLQGGDVTYLSARTPGGARIANGELSGQMAYRGLFGERLNLRVDGQRLASGGPNLMDPVFHYAPAPLVAAMVIDRGVSPVSEGPGLAGGADAVFKKIDFAAGEDISYGYDLSFGARSVNDSYAAGGVAGAATDTWRFNGLGDYEDAGDTGYKDGKIGGTTFARNVFGLSTGLRLAQNEFSLDLRRQNAGPAGNPPFPMDISFIDTDFARLGYKTVIGTIRVDASLNYADVAHRMDNYSLRPAPMAMMKRATDATAITKGANLAVAFKAAGGMMKLGADIEDVEHDVTITNPMNADFYVSAFPDINMKRTGAFAEWTGSLGPVEAELGTRVDRNEFGAGTAILGPALPMGPQMLAMAFNNTDTSSKDTTSDFMARLWTPSENGLSWRATLARKQKMPGYIQRFGWLPISASGGLADGNIYVGDVTLDPETAWIAEAGFDYASTNAYVRPTVFLRQIDNYVQGVPYDATPGVVDSMVETIAAMNGDPTPLRWANVDARLYGLDMDAGYDFAGPLRLDAVFSYVSGERRDIDDNLYRIAPASLTTGLTWEADKWSATLETRAVAEQNEVSLTNSEAKTPGHVVVNLYGDWQVREGVKLSAGVGNLLDQVYRDHLAGYNRNGFGDVAVGTRVPGAGRGVFVRLSLVGMKG